MTMPNLREGHGKGEEAVTHFACEEMIKASKGFTRCCGCTGHSCQQIDFLGLTLEAYKEASDIYHQSKWMQSSDGIRFIAGKLKEARRGSIY